MTWNARDARDGHSLRLQEAVAVPSGEGRWPRICESRCARVALAVRCDHVL